MNHDNCFATNYEVILRQRRRDEPKQIQKYGDTKELREFLGKKMPKCYDFVLTIICY